MRSVSRTDGNMGGERTRDKQVPKFHLCTGEVYELEERHRPRIELLHVQLCDVLRNRVQVSAAFHLDVLKSAILKTYHPQKQSSSSEDIWPLGVQLGVPPVRLQCLCVTRLQKVLRSHLQIAFGFCLQRACGLHLQRLS